jgi:predicted nuclease of predicted toxin-antitoxin system
MKIFVDENIPLITVEELRSKVFDVADIRGSSEQGMPDEQLWLKVQEEKRLLITTDKGFSNYRNEAHHGILIIRLRQPTRLKIHQRVMQAITRYPEEQWPGLMVVMRDNVQSSWRSRHS